VSSIRRSWGRFKIRVKSGHKAGGRPARTRFVISPITPRLALPAILVWIWRMLRSVEAARLSISLTVRAVTGGRPRCLPPAAAAFMPAVTRSLISDDSNSAMAPMMVNVARPIGLGESLRKRAAKALMLDANAIT
jgi:hypothetical protein